MHGRIIWAGLFGAAIGFEAYAFITRHSDLTLTRVTQGVFHTHTRTGRAVFTGAIGSITVAFITHILTDHNNDADPSVTPVPEVPPQVHRYTLSTLLTAHRS